MKIADKIRHSYTFQAFKHCHTVLGLAMAWSVYLIVLFIMGVSSGVWSVSVLMFGVTWILFFSVLMLWRKVKIMDADRTMSVLETE